MKKYDTFLVDADDTLFDFKACCKKALYKAMGNVGIPCTDSDYLDYLSINDALWAQLERKEITHEELLNRRFPSFLKKKGLEERGMELNAEYVECLSDACIEVEGARAFLAKLADMGRVYIITNGTASVQHRRFKAFQMERYVQGVFISEEVGAYKPSADFFVAVKAGIKDFKAENSLIIGDGLTSDILLANNVGLDCVWFNPHKKPLHTAIPTYTAQTFEEIIDIIKNQKNF